MSSQPKYVDATFYVQLRAEKSNFRGVDPSGNRILERASLANATISRPSKQQPGTVLMKLTVRVLTGAFLPLQPEAIVVIPEDMTVLEPVEVEAGDANGGGQ